MHAEWATVSEATIGQIVATRQAGGRVFAVGTTVVRTLESAARSGTLQPFAGQTDLLLVEVDAGQLDIRWEPSRGGALFPHLYGDLPEGKRGGAAEDSAAILPLVLAGLRAGDAVMVKGSLGSRMGPLVEAMKAKWPAAKDT